MTHIVNPFFDLPNYQRVFGSGYIGNKTVSKYGFFVSFSVPQLQSKRSFL